MFARAICRAYDQSQSVSPQRLRPIPKLSSGVVMDCTFLLTSAMTLHLYFEAMR